jgi:hypothetical protein
VRLRLKQHCFIVDANVDVNVDVNLDHHAERRRSIGNSAGILRDWQSGRQRRSAGTDAKHIAERRVEHVGFNDAYNYSTDHFIYDGKHYPVKQFYICKRERP